MVAIKIKDNSLNLFTIRLLDWYYQERRNLPWRKNREPYQVWLSEIILQQTRVAQGLPYYHAFINRFPTINQLAEADQDEVLRLWQGLGYYSRARNLHTCAKQIVDDHDGHFPSSSKELQQLKGIGKYTAAAIASICFSEKIPVIDGNVYRVLSRVFDMDTDISQSRAYNEFAKYSEKLISSESPGDYNQAIMEFGALHCTPKQPKCSICPLMDLCVAYQKGIVKERPVKKAKITKRVRVFNYFLFNHSEYLLIRQRNNKDIWQGLYEFYNLEGDYELNTLMQMIKDQIGPTLQDGIIHDIRSGFIRHVLTHQYLNVEFHMIEVESIETLKKISESLQLKMIKSNQINKYGKPIIIENFLKNKFISLF